MNYILNNKLKFEKNRYNKPVIAHTPIILTKTLKNPTIPLPIKIDLPQYSYSYSYFQNSESMIDFKLNNHSTQLNQIIKQINEPRPKTQSLEVEPERIQTEIIQSEIEPYYNELIVNLYGFSEIHLNTIRLYEFLLELSKKFKIKIYIHTWNINRLTIDYYFQGLNVVSVLIDQTDETTDETTDGPNIFSSNTSLSYWKLMWISMYRSMNEIYKKEDDRTIILNARFDINYNFDINSLTSLRQNKFTKNIFLKDSTDLSGVDNPIIGDKHTLHKLISTFYNNLDNVSMFYSSFTIPEASIYYENNRIFGVNYNNMFENIEKYSK
jgi:hypothetical protein